MTYRMTSFVRNRHCPGNREVDGPRDHEIDQQLELRRLLDRDVAGLGALQDLVDEEGRSAPDLDMRPIGHQPARLGIEPERCLLQEYSVSR